MPALDVEVLIRLRADIGGDDATMRELADAFFSQAPRLIEEARASVAPDERQRLIRAAHTLRSSAVTFGAQKLAGIARKLETEALAGQVGEAGDHVTALAEEYEAVEREFRAWLAGLARGNEK